MRVKELGQTGVFVPEVGVGTWNYHSGPEPLRRAVEAGAWFVDTAESYGTEPLVAEAIAGIRHRVFLATKVSPEHFSRADLHNSVNGSLQRLRTEVIDLLQLHQPNAAVPIAETMSAVAEMINAGKVRFAGVSNFSVAELKAAQQALEKYPIVSNQVRYNLVDRTIEEDLLPFCQANHITVIAYSPLGRLFSRIRDCDPSNVLDELAAATGKTPAQIAVNWCLLKDGVIAIPGSNSVEHLLENCASSDWRLTADQASLLDSRIQYRVRNRFDKILRQRLPAPLHSLAARTLNAMPRFLRRRFI